jgi:hypothetical protein
MSRTYRFTNHDTVSHAYEGTGHKIIADTDNGNFKYIAFLTDDKLTRKAKPQISPPKKVSLESVFY